VKPCPNQSQFRRGFPAALPSVVAGEKVLGGIGVLRLRLSFAFAKLKLCSAGQDFFRWLLGLAVSADGLRVAVEQREQWIAQERAAGEQAGDQRVFLVAAQR